MDESRRSKEKSTTAADRGSRKQEDHNFPKRQRCLICLFVDYLFCPRSVSYFNQKTDFRFADEWSHTSRINIPRACSAQLKRRPVFHGSIVSIYRRSLVAPPPSFSTCPLPPTHYRFPLSFHLFRRITFIFCWIIWYSS